MDTRAEETAALLALLRLKDRGEPWGAIAAEVADEGSAQIVYDMRFGSALLPSPRAAEAREEARALVGSWLDEDLNFVTVLDRAYPTRLGRV